MPQQVTTSPVYRDTLLYGMLLLYPELSPKGVLSYSARTVQSLWNVHPTFTPLNGPHRTTPRAPISAPCGPCWHTGNFLFLG